MFVKIFKGKMKIFLSATANKLVFAVDDLRRDSRNTRQNESEDCSEN